MKQKFKTKIALSFLAFLLIGLGAFLVPSSKIVEAAAQCTDKNPESGNGVWSTKETVYPDENFRVTVQSYPPNEVRIACAAANLKFEIEFKYTSRPPDSAGDGYKKFTIPAGKMYSGSTFVGFQGDLVTTYQQIYSHEFAEADILVISSIKIIDDGAGTSRNITVPTDIRGIKVEPRNGQTGEHGERSGVPPILPTNGEPPPQEPTDNCFDSFHDQLFHVNKNTVGIDEPFIIYSQVFLPENVKEQCSALTDVVFDFIFEPGIILTYAGTAGTEGAKYGYFAGHSVTAKQILGNTTAIPSSIVMKVLAGQQGKTGKSLTGNITITVDSTPGSTHDETTPVTDVNSTPVTREGGGLLDGGSGPGPVEAAVDFLLDLLTGIFSAVIAIVSSILALIVTGLVVPLIEALIGIQTYKDSFVAVILPGWIVLRNLSNIFFILVLLVIGLATIFRVQGYQYKQLLVNLVIAAVLVNFSLVIGQSILGLADTVQTQLLPPPKTDGTFEFTPVRRLAYVLIAGPSLNTLSKSIKNVVTAGTAGEGLGNLFLPFISLAMALGTTVLFVAIAAMLFIRIIALWILLMLSPLAYVAGVLPNTKSFQKMWWDKFLKYAFYAVILAFFLNIAAFISSNGSTEVDLSLTQSILADLVKNGSNPGFTKQYENISDFVFTIGSNLLVMVFLIIGMKATSSLSLIGSKAIGNFAEKGFKMPFVAGAAGAVGAGKATGRGAAALADLGRDKLSLNLGNKGLFGKAAAGLLNFGATKKEFGGILADMKAKRKGQVSAMGHDIASGVGGRIPLVRSDQSYKFDENHQTAVREARTEFENHDRDKLLEELAKLKGKTGRDDQTRSQVLIELVSEKGGMEDLMLQEGFAADRAGYMGFMNKKLADGELTEAQGGYLAKKLSDEGKKNNESWYTYGYGYNDSGRLRLLNNSVEDASGVNVHDAEQAAIEIAEARAVAAAPPSADLEKVKKDAREAYIEALDPVRKELYRNGEYLKKMAEAQERDEDKMGLRAYAKDGGGSQWAPKAADGTYRLSSHAIRTVAGSTSDEMDAAAGSLEVKTRQRLIKAFSDPAKQTEAINDIASHIQTKHEADTGEKMDNATAQRLATEKFATFSDSLLRHDFSTGKDVVKANKEAVQAVITKNISDPKYKDFADSHNNIDPHIKNNVTKNINELLANPTAMSNKQLTDIIAPTNRVGVNTGHLAAGARKYVGDTFAARFNAKTVGLTGTANGNRIRDQISEAFQATMIAHPDLAVGATGFKAAFEAELKTKFSAAAGLPQTAKIIDQVTAGLK